MSTTTPETIVVADLPQRTTSHAALSAAIAVDGSILDKDVNLIDLVDVDSFREVMATFADLYRVGVKVFDAAGNKLVDIRVGNSQFCGYLWEFGGTRQACTRIVTGRRRRGRASRRLLLGVALRRRADHLRG